MFVELLEEFGEYFPKLMFEFHCQIWSNELLAIDSAINSFLSWVVLKALDNKQISLRFQSQ
jgi:hypothetical protein